MYKDTIIVAELKRKSPRGEILTENSLQEQMWLADQAGDIVSIHTNPIWGGSFEDIRIASALTNNPILAKGFHATDDEVRRAIDYGATYVLVVGRQPGVHRDKCWIETLTLGELAYIPNDQWAVWNSRDLASLKDIPGIPDFLLKRWAENTGDSDRKRGSFAEARSMRYGLLCQASNLRTIADIQPGADAVLVGTHLEEFARSLGISL